MTGLRQRDCSHATSEGAIRILALICATIALAGCGDAVTSPKPLFTIKDAHGQAQLRSGVWGYSPSTKLPTCKVDTTQPVGTWDSCAGGMVIHPGGIYGRRKADAPLEQGYRSVLARGAPAILQLIDPSQAPAEYDYFGLQPTKFDSHGNIVELKAWLALCGLPTPQNPQGVGLKLTDRLLPGLTADARKYNCIATAQGPVRASARQSGVWTAKSGGELPVLYLQWVRDGDN